MNPMQHDSLVFLRTGGAFTRRSLSEHAAGKVNVKHADATVVSELKPSGNVRGPPAVYIPLGP